jgi:flavin reductase (DIM6/NTAB) family NADH-FMN oxidoreductase RutF
VKTDIVADPAQLRRAYGTFPTGVVTVAAVVGLEPLGLAASSFTSVSIDPPLVSVSIAHTSTTWPRLSRAPRLGVSVLSGVQDIVGQQMSIRDTDRFAGVAWTVSESGAVFIDDAVSWFETSVHDVVPAGDHDIVLLRIGRLGADDEREPLIFHASRFRRIGQ